jgi:NAD(P)-dependent dehydrogenase (short-subunit alcohol dehydrogenase family)
VATVLVTGASRGIGLQFARQYAADGWKVLAAARDVRKAADLHNLAGDVAVLAMDVADDRSIAALARELEGQPIDILINNAGVSGRREGAPRGSDSDMQAVDTDHWLKVFRINSIGPFLVTRAFRRNLAQGDRKLVASLTSRLGSIAANDSGGMYVYRSSKAALNMINKSLALELRSDGIACLVFHPGWVQTDMGGQSAPVTPEQSVQGMRRILDRAGLADSGKFFDYSGPEIPW